MYPGYALFSLRKPIKRTQRRTTKAVGCNIHNLITVQQCLQSDYVNRTTYISQTYDDTCYYVQMFTDVNQNIYRVL